MIGENLLYLMVWMVIILVPVLNSKMLEEVHVSLENILIAWLKITLSADLHHPQQPDRSQTVTAKTSLCMVSGRQSADHYGRFLAGRHL